MRIPDRPLRPTRASLRLRHSRSTLLTPHFLPTVSLKLARNVRLGVKNLLLHKLRSMLTMLGVVFGVGSVVAMLSVGQGASQEAQEQIKKLGSNNILINAQVPVSEAGNSGGQRTRLSQYGILYADLDRIEGGSIPDVQNVVPAKTVRKQARLGTKVEELRLVGTTPSWFDLVQRPILAGRTFGPQDMNSFNDVVVLTESGARKLLSGDSTVGNRVRFEGGGSYEVIGVIKSENGGGAAGGLPTPDQDVDAYIPLPVMRERFGDLIVEITSGNFRREQVELHQLIVQVDRQENVEAVAAAVQRMFETYHPKADYKMVVPLALLERAREQSRIFNIVLGSIAGISLLVGGIGIMNIMLASVTERTREIGIRRAIGAKRRQIIGQFLIETLVLSTVGGLIGVGLGVVIPQIIKWRAGMPVSTEGWMLGLSVGISMFIGVVFGLYPAVRAANLDPIQALAPRVRAEPELATDRHRFQRIRTDQKRVLVLRSTVDRNDQISLMICVNLCLESAPICGYSARRFARSFTAFQSSGGVGTTLKRLCRSSSQPAKNGSALISFNVTGRGSRFSKARSTTANFSSPSFGSAYGGDVTLAMPTTAFSLPVW